MKRILGIFIILLSIQTCMAQEFLQGNLSEDILFKGKPIKITPVTKITTSKSSLKVGNGVSFVVARDVLEDEAVVIKKNTPVKGKVLEIKPNLFMGVPAKIVMGEFETSDVFGEIVPLKGEVKKEGNPHNTLISYLDILALFVRGGEVQVLPDEDYFEIYY